MNPHAGRFEQWTAYLLALFLFFAPFSIAGAQMSLGAALVVLVVGMIFTGANPFQTIPRSVLIVIGLWLLWQVICSLVNQNPVRSVLGLREHWLFLIVPAVAYVWRRRSDMLLGGLALGMIFAGLIGVWQYLLGGTPLRHIDLIPAPGFGHRATGYFGLLVTYGNLFAVATSGLIGFLLTGKWKGNAVVARLLWTAAAIGVVAVILNFSRASLAGLVITALLSLFLASRSRRIVAAIFLSGLIAGIFLVPGTTDRFLDQWNRDFGGEFEGGRVFIWEHSLPLIENHPLFGVGPSNFRDEYVKQLRPDISELHKHSHAHNDFLTMAATTGLPGLALYLLMWGVIVIPMFRYRFCAGATERANRPIVTGVLAASICFLGLSFFHDPFLDEEVRQLMMFFWAVGLISMYKTSEQGESRDL